MTVLDGYTHIVITCFTDELSVVRAAVRQQLAKWNYLGLESEADIDLTRIYAVSPRPGGAHPLKMMLFCPKSHPGSTVMFTNYQDGWHSLAVCVSKLVTGRVFHFGLGSERDEWPGYVFERLAKRKEVRHVSLIKDVDRWKFWQEGEPLPEEVTAVYRKRRVRDRLTREYLVSLAERLGFPVGDDRFWESEAKAMYFEQQRVAQRGLP